MDKLSAKCGALGDNLKAMAAGNAKQEKSKNLSKQDLADFAFKSAERS